jgi:WD40 repeat protein
MTADSPCPDAHDLQRLLDGRASDEEAARLAAHLAGCAACGRAAEGLPAGDPLAQALCGCAAGHAPAGYGPEADALLRRLQARGMLATEVDAGDSTDQSPGPPPGAEGEPSRLDFLAPPQGPGEVGRLGPFRVLAELGRGGMGVVFRAHDPLADRPVALKVMQPRLASGEAHRRRFLREARAAAGLRHDHVVTVYQVGEDRGVPYLAMELLQGETLEDRLAREGRLAQAEAARIAREAARGLAAAHAKGLTHRDVKPANLWLEAGSGRVKVLDFGLARAADDAEGLTGAGCLPGTVPYMSPEQVAGAGPVGPPTDVYALGVVLYRMLAGRLPFGGTALELAYRITHENPPRPSRFRAGLDPGLEAVVKKAMARRPQDRYGSAAAFAEALDHWLAGGRPLAARRRARLVRAAAAALLLAGGGLLAAQIVIHIKDRDGRTVGRVEIPGGHTVEITRDGKPLTPDAMADPGKAAKGVTPPPAGQPGGVPGLEFVLGAEGWRHWLAGRDCDEWPGVAFLGGGDRVVVWSYAVDGDKQVIRLRDARTGGYLGHPFERPPNRTNTSAQYALDDQKAALLAGDSRAWSWKLWPAADPTRFVLLQGEGAVSRCLALSRDGKRAASGTWGGTLLLWDAATGAADGGPLPVVSPGHVEAVALTADGALLAAVAVQKVDDHHVTSLRLWDVRERKERASVPLPEAKESAGHALAFTPDGGTLLVGVSAGGGLALQVWDVGAAAKRLDLPDRTTLLALSPDGKILACPEPGGTIRLRDLSGKVARTLKGHRGDVTGVAFSPDGGRLASVSKDDGSVRLWDVETGRPLGGPAGDDHGPVRCVALRPDGKTLAAAQRHTVAVWDVASPAAPPVRLLLERDREPRSMALGPQGRTLAACAAPGLYVWDLDTLERVRGHLKPMGPLGFSPDGKALAAGAQDGKTIELWDAATWQELPPLGTHDGANLLSLAFAPPDGAALASGSGLGSVRLWDVQGRRELKCLAVPGSDARCLAYSADGKLLAAGGRGGAVVWEAGTGKELPLEGMFGGVTGLAFAPDGRTLFACGAGGEVGRWRLAPEGTWQKGHGWRLPGPVYGLALSADGRRLFTANGNGTVYALRAGGDEKGN